MTTSQTIDTAAQPSPEVPPPAAPDHLTDRVKNGLVVVRRRLETAEQRARAQIGGVPAQLRAVPAQLRESLDRLLRSARERVRTGLNLPSHAEIEALIARVEELDRKLAALTRQTVVEAPAAEAAPSAEGRNKGKKKHQNGR